MQPTARPHVQGWSGPEQISTRLYGAVSLIVDPAGVAHAAVDDSNDQAGSSIFYLTNGGGEWTRDRLFRGSAGRRSVTAYWSPIIGQDTDGSLWLAFEHVNDAYPDDFGFWTQGAATHLATTESGGWSRPAPISSGDSPSLVVRDGVIHLAEQEPFAGDIRCGGDGGEPFAMSYRTNAGGEWADEQVTDDGLWPRLALGSDARPRILYSGDFVCATDSTEGPGLSYATAATAAGSFSIEPVPGTPYDAAIALALDGDDRPHILFYRERPTDDSYGEAWYAVRGPDGWNASELLFEDARPLSMAVDSEGAAHVIARGIDGIWYSTNRSGRFEAALLWTPPWDGDLYSDEGYWDTSATMALGPDDRPHVLFTITRRVPDGAGLWYTVGPAD